MTSELPAREPTAGAPPALDAAVVSLCGPVREENQDAAFIAELSGGALLGVVSDGMGGHRDGRQAAEITVREIGRALREASLETWSERLERAIACAHEAIRTGTAEAGATVVVAILEPSAEPGAPWRLHLGHVGDSRAYLVRGAMLLRLTADHSVVAQWVRDGHLSEDEAFHHPDRNLLARALGQAEALKIEIAPPLVLSPGDRIILTSDGVHGVLPEAALAALAGAPGSAADIASAAVTAALAAGSEDNLSILCLEVPAATTSSSRATRPEVAVPTEVSS